MTQKTQLPPRGFRPAGPIERVSYSHTQPPFVKAKRRYGRRAEGLRYEKKAHDFFFNRFPDWYVQSPWFVFREIGATRDRWCQPDALLFDIEGGQIRILEYKLQHTSDAWWQLKWLYLPVVAAAFPTTRWNITLCEITKWYDPATAFPEKVKLRADVLDVKPGEFGVHIWKP